MDEERRIVTVSTDSIDAYAEPQFVLEHEGKIYVTLAVIEYDPDDDLDEDEAADLAQLRAVLEGGRDVSGTVLAPPREPPTTAQTQEKDDIN